MSVLPLAYPEQKPVFLRSGDPISMPEHIKYVSLREYLLAKTVAAHTREAIELVGPNKSNVRVRSISDHPYNCVGMVLANRRAWIDLDSDEIEDLLAKDGFKKILPQELSVGDVVLYEHDNEFTHIGMVICVDSENVTNIWVMSKWGFAGEMIHHLHDVPGEYGLGRHFWSERVTDETV